MIEITYALALLIFGGALGIGGIVWGKKKETRKTMGVIGGIAFLIGVLPMIGVTQLDMLNQQIDFGGETLTQLPTTPGAPTLCAIEDTTVTLSAIDKYTSAAAGTTHRYKINGAPALTVSNAGTFTASPGDQLQILWGNGEDTTYFGAVDTVTVPCSGTKTYDTELYANGTLTIEVFNEEGNLIDGSAENETLAAGDVVTLEAKLKGQYQKGFIYGGVIVAEWNSSELDDVVVDFGGSETSVPQIYTITFSTTSSTKAYSVPAIISNQILTGSIVLDADDSANPLDATDPVLTFYPNDYFINEDAGASFDGPAAEDEDDVQTFAHSTAFTVHTD